MECLLWNGKYWKVDDFIVAFVGRHLWFAQGGEKKKKKTIVAFKKGDYSQI